MNIDGASRWNPDISCWSLCVRDEKGDKLQPEAKAMKNPLITNTQAQTITILLMENLGGENSDGNSYLQGKEHASLSFTNHAFEKRDIVFKNF